MAIILAIRDDRQNYFVCYNKSLMSTVSMVISFCFLADLLKYSLGQHAHECEKLRSEELIQEERSSFCHFDAIKISNKVSIEENVLILLDNWTMIHM